VVDVDSATKHHGGSTDPRPASPGTRAARVSGRNLQQVEIFTSHPGALRDNPIQKLGNRLADEREVLRLTNPLAPQAS